MKYTIIIPYFLDNARLSAMAYFARCLMFLPMYNKDISVISDNSLLSSKVSHVLSDHPEMTNKNGGLASLFMVNDHIFMIVDTDTPTKNSHRWIPHYSKHVSGFFIACNRYSTLYIFDNCPVPVFSSPIGPDYSLPVDFLEHEAHSTAMTVNKDISVFFRGRYNLRLPRKFLAELIQASIPNTNISNSGDDKKMPAEKYINLMGRSKIAWCPRSVKAPPDPDCNAVTGRDCEAMCLECLVMRPSIGVIETEKRISGVHFVEYQNDASDLVEKIQYYLEHHDERKEIAYNGRLWWERNGSTVARAKRIFSDCLKVLEGEL